MASLGSSTSPIPQSQAPTCKSRSRDCLVPRSLHPSIQPDYTQGPCPKHLGMQAEAFPEAGVAKRQAWHCYSPHVFFAINEQQQMFLGA